MESRLCKECGDKLRGRVDQKFCSDYCRNTYNNRLNSDSTKYIRRVNNILRKNRRILSELNPTGKLKVDEMRLAEEGFNFHYFTNTYITKNEFKNLEPLRVGRDQCGTNVGTTTISFTIVED